MNTVLTNIYAAIGLSFKFVFRSILVDPILNLVDTAIWIPEAERTNFKNKDVRSTYDVMGIINKAWDLVPKNVDLSGWLLCEILASKNVINASKN